MREIKQPDGKHSNVFSRHLEPIAQVKPDEEVMIHIVDGLYDVITSESDIPSQLLGDLNPLTGPIFVEGAEPGDTLVVHILDILPARDWAVSMLIPYMGGLTATESTPMLHDPLPEKVWKYQLKDDMLTNNNRLSFPWNPLLGTIGTAPEFESLSSLTPHKHGGDMDIPDIKPGNALHLPVNVPGAYFFTGDCHAAQGEGELGGVAIEISAKVRLKFELIKGKTITWPRIESDDKLMAIGSARPMEDAARIAYKELLDWLVELGWDQYEAYQALTHIGELTVGNMVDTYYSLVARIDKKYAYKR